MKEQRESLFRQERMRAAGTTVADLQYRRCWHHLQLPHAHLALTTHSELNVRWHRLSEYF